MTDELTENQEQGRAVYALAASPDYAADGVCFAATASGLLVSVDHAATFADAYRSLQLPAALPTPAVALTPCFASDHTVFAGVFGSVLRSHDRGATWQVAELRTPPPVVSCLAVSPAYERDGIAFAGTLQDGVFRSADRGTRWAAWNFGLIDLQVLCLALSAAFGQDDTLVAGTETGLFRSTNGGRAWRELGLPTALAPVLSVAFSPNYTKDGTLFAGTEADGLWVSHDRGRGWDRLETLGDAAINALLVDYVRETIVLVVLADDEIRISRDAGTTWADLPLAGAEPTCLAAPSGLAPGAHLLAGCADGLVEQVSA